MSWSSPLFLGLVHEDLKAFLSSNLPSGQTVGIVDPKLLQVVKEEVGCKVAGGEVVQEVCRGIRLHMNNFVKALEEKKENMAQLGLGHSYSRSKVKFNVNRSDNMVIQAIALIDQLDKARIRNRIIRPVCVTHILYNRRLTVLHRNCLYIVGA